MWWLATIGSGFGQEATVQFESTRPGVTIYAARVGQEAAGLCATPCTASMQAGPISLAASGAGRHALARTVELPAGPSLVSVHTGSRTLQRLGKTLAAGGGVVLVVFGASLLSGDEVVEQPVGLALTGVGAAAIGAGLTFNLTQRGGFTVTPGIPPSGGPGR